MRAWRGLAGALAIIVSLQMGACSHAGGSAMIGDVVAYPVPVIEESVVTVDVPLGQAAVTLRATYPRISALDVSSLRQADAAPYSISYALDAPALVRLRLVDRDCPGSVLRTLVDWEPRAAGAQVETWDGNDRKGEPVSARNVSVVLEAEPNLSAGEGYWDETALLQLRYPEFKHMTHDRALCHDLDVTLTVPAEGANLRGPVQVCAELGAHRGMPLGEYHVVLYLDGRSAWDGRVSEGAFCQTWDTGNVPDGTYRLAVTFNDLQDHSGSDWVSVSVRNGD